MKVLFKNTTRYDKKNHNNFSVFHNGKYGKRDSIQEILILICIIYVIILNITVKNWIFLTTLLLSLLIFLLYVQLKKNKVKKREKVKEYTFYFYEKYMKIRYKRKSERMSYLGIRKIFETNDNFFLYLDRKHSLILDKECFEIGTSKEFSQFIRRKCPFRYSRV